MATVKKDFFSPPARKSVFKEKLEKMSGGGGEKIKPNIKYSTLSEEKYMTNDKLFSNLSQKPDEPITHSTMLSDIKYRERDFPKKMKNQTKLVYDSGFVEVYTPMIDIVNKKKLPERTDIKCFWCRHSFNTPPLGIPIKWVDSVCEIIGCSGLLSRKKVSTIERKNIENNSNKDPRIKLTVNEYYEVDGIYCSFNCMRAALIEKKNIYKDSYLLLNNMYRKITGITPGPHDIVPAPSWRILKDYGGDMDIDNFRRTFSKFKYLDTKNIIRPVTRMYQKINLNK